mmetsp:Transcript_9250/g.17975  ORF Transcript_9250/g.17975 Transcript_9250/m.17975 type:complete len:213 (-) Transcript_9250:438-1076(-)
MRFHLALRTRLLRVERRLVKASTCAYNYDRIFLRAKSNDGFPGVGDPVGSKTPFRAEVARQDPLHERETGLGIGLGRFWGRFLFGLRLWLVLSTFFVIPLDRLTKLEHVYCAVVARDCQPLRGWVEADAVDLSPVCSPSQFLQEVARSSVEYPDQGSLLRCSSHASPAMVQCDTRKRGFVCRDDGGFLQIVELGTHLALLVTGADKHGVSRA